VDLGGWSRIFIIHFIAGLKACATQSLPGNAVIASTPAKFFSIAYD